MGPHGLAVLAIFVLAQTHARADDKPSPEAEAFFETRVRPVLAEKCVSCHGPTKQWSGLRLDSREALLKGGESGPAVVPGDPDKSLLVQAARHQGDIKMPPEPKPKLPDADTQALATWVKQGAHWPAGKLPAKAIQAATHWSFQPVKPVAPPKIATPGLAGWVSSPIDSFVAKALQAKGLTPSPIADRRTLLRRVTVDLTGLPPTPEEVDAFLRDPLPDRDAFAKVVDRLLASPRYGERWARHWLDVARYADTKGYVFQEERKYPFAWTYRDYVIRAFNEDLPYDRFVIEQLAADQVPSATSAGDNHHLAALGFLTVGRRFLNDQNEILDDRIDVVGRGLQGLTISCARCHDHKFDPIPQEDYYSLYGVFASSVEPAELPILETPAASKSRRDYEQKRAKAQADLDAFVNGQKAAMEQELRTRFAAYFDAAQSVNWDPRGGGLGGPLVAASVARGLRVEVLRWLVQRGGPLVGKGMDANAHDPWLAPYRVFAALKPDEFAAKAPALAKSIAANADKAKPIDPMLAKAFAGPAPKNMAEVAKIYGQVYARAARIGLPDPKVGPPGSVKAPAPGPAIEAVRKRLTAANGVLDFASGDPAKTLPRAARGKFNDLKGKVTEIDSKHPGAPVRAMVVSDMPKPVDPVVFLRGNPGRRGKPVPRQFLAAVSGPARKPFGAGSGRLDLARAIASRENPLTARVFVNRVWQHHFGRGIVATPSDFGARGELPSHPELLDYLADQFMKNGWSVKALHRAILLSSTYRQASTLRPECLNADPENRLLWRQNRRRLDLESLRDGILAIAGRLDTAMGGPGVPLWDEPFPRRRTVYAFIDRQNLEGTFRAFDFASPDASAPARPSTTVPQQSLFLLNSPFLLEQARAFARRPDVAALDGNPEAKIDRLYRLVYGRGASQPERDLGRRYLAALASANASDRPGGWQYGTAPFDAKQKKIGTFKPLSTFTGGSWQMDQKLPAPRYNFTSITPNGGHPGPSAAYSTVLRWVPPADGTVSVRGTLGHKEKQGDGVELTVLARGRAPLAHLVAHAGEAGLSLDKVPVRKGEPLDFVVSPRATDAFDSYGFSPTIQLTPADPNAPKSLPLTHNLRADFQGPPPAAPSPWDEYAQVLLLSNEFLFVD